MASFSVQYIFNLVDRFTPGARKLGGAAKAMSQSVHAAGKAANAAASGVGRYGSAAAAAARQVTALTQAIARSQAAMGRHMRSIGHRGQNLGMLGGLGMMTGGFFTGRKILQQAREASKAENKFRSLVDSVTDEEMKSLKDGIQKQMRITGESFAELMDAAGDAAQIVGSAGLAKHVMMAASSLAKIDTASKDTKFFAENIAAVVGPGGTMEEVARISDMLAKQQKLGAATAGGTIEAYKNVVADKDLRGFDPVAMMTAIGMIKNKAPALQDSQIGNMAKYGLRVLNSPTSEMQKKLAKYGLTAKSFETDGKFDIAKTQKMFAEMTKTAKGMDQLKDIFAGRNVLAGQFWQMLASMDPNEFEKYQNALLSSSGSVMAAVRERMKGLDGALTRLEGAGFSAALAIGEWLTPALTTLAAYAESAADAIGPMLANFATNYPVLSEWAGMAAIAAAGLSMMAIPLAAIAFSLRMLGVGAGLRMLTGLISGIAVGSFAGAKSVAHLLGTVGRVAGPAAAAALAMKGVARVAGKVLKWYVVFEGIQFFWDNWEKIKAVAKDPIKFAFEFPDAPEWLKNFFSGVATEKAKQQARWAEEAFAKDTRNNDWMAYSNVVNMEAYRKAKAASDEARRTYTPFQQMQSAVTPDVGWFGRLTGTDGYDWSNPTIHPGMNAGANAAAIPQSMAVSVTSTTSFEPATINVNVTGTVNGPVTGSGSGTVTAKPARGVSASDAGSAPGVEYGP